MIYRYQTNYISEGNAPVPSAIPMHIDSSKQEEEGYIPKARHCLTRFTLGNHRPGLKFISPTRYCLNCSTGKNGAWEQFEEGSIDYERGDDVLIRTVHLGPSRLNC